MAKKLSILERAAGLFKPQADSKNATAPTVVQPNRRSGHVLGLSTGNKVTPAELYVGYAKAAIRVVANRFASEMLQNLRAYDSKGKEVPLDRHPLGAVIMNPQMGNTTYDIWEQIAINLEVHGQSFPHFLRNQPATKHVGLEVMPSDQVKIKEWTADKMQPDLYEFSPDKTLTYEVRPEDVIFLKHYNPQDPRFGYSSIAGAGDHHVTEQAAAAHVKNHLYNSGFQNLVVVLREALGNEAFSQFKNDFAAMFSGAAASGKNIFLNGVEADIKELNSKISDLNIEGISKTAIDAILSSFGVSRAMIGLEGENLNRATAEVQERQLIQNVVIPLMRKTIAGINQFSSRYTSYTTGVTFGFIDPSVESVDEELVKAQTVSQKAQTVAVLVASGMELERAIKIAKVEEDGSEQRSDGNTNKIDRMKRNAVKNAKSRLSTRKWKQYQKTHSDPRIDEAADVLISGLKNHYQKLRSKVLRQFKKDNGFGVSDVFVIDEAAAVASEIRPGLMDLYALAGNETIGLMWELSEADVLLKAPFKPSQLLLERTQALIDRAAKSVSETNSQLINDVITKGLAAEKTQTEIAREIDEAFNGQIERWRADRLARTEVVRINNLGEQDSVKQWADIVGAKVFKVWRTNSPEPCEFCQALNGNKAEVSDLFVGQNGKVVGVDGGILQNTYDDLETPPIHPNCACSVNLEVE